MLNVYAFCNLHDVSWGTKGSDKAEALPSVSSKKAKDADTAVVEETTRKKEDLDETFKETVTRALTKLETKEEIEKPTMDDGSVGRVRKSVPIKSKIVLESQLGDVDRPAT